MTNLGTQSLHLFNSFNYLTHLTSINAHQN